MPVPRAMLRLLFFFVYRGLCKNRSIDGHGMFIWSAVIYSLCKFFIVVYCMSNWNCTLFINLEHTTGEHACTLNAGPVRPWLDQYFRPKEGVTGQ